MLRVRAFRLAGVHGTLYQPAPQAPILVGAAGIAFDDPQIRWVQAGQLIASLNEFTITEPTT